MPALYRYRARDHSGQLAAGTVRSEDVLSVENYLESLDFIPVKVWKPRDFSLGKLLHLGKKKPRLEDMILVTRNLSTLYRAGIPILRSLEIISEQYEENVLGEILLEIRDDMERGEHLSESMANHPAAFSGIYVASVRAAEASGKLDVVLDRLAEAAEQEMVTREEVKKALRYPLTVMCAIAAAFVILTTFVIPRFAQFYSTYGAELPAPTRVMMFLGDMMSHLWYVIFPGIGTAIYGLVRLVKHPRLAGFVDSALLKLPVIGVMLTKTALSRFSHILSVLIASGTPLIQSLDIVKEAVGNSVIGEEVGKLSEGMRQGRSLAESRHQMQHFPKLALSLMNIGLESGTLELTLKEICRFFDREVQYTSSRLTSLLEPFIITIVAVMVLFLALAIFLPMWNLISVFRG